MHIKKHTKGKSNEISFDVLEAKKGLDANDDQEDNPLGRISMFTLGKRKPPATPSRETKLPINYVAPKTSSAKRPAWEYPREEVANKKAKRKRGKRLLITVVAAGLTCAAVLGGIAIVQGIQRQQEFLGNLDKQIEATDAVYDATYDFRSLVDDALNTPLPDLNAADLRERYERVKDTSSPATKLRATKTAVENLQGSLTSRGDIERSNKVLSSINAQLNLLEMGGPIVEDVLEAATQYAQAEDYMTLVLQADSAAREGASASTDLTDETARASMQKSDEALNLFATARDTLQKAIDGEMAWFTTEDTQDSSQSFVAEEAQEAGSEEGQDADQETPAPTLESVADIKTALQPFIDYVNLRIDAQQAAKDADQGYLSRSSATMIEANDRYNALEFKAADLYAQIKENVPSKIILSAYESAPALAQQKAAWLAEFAKCTPLL